ncbi:MAG: hypothetical protein LBP27_01250 [Treponema sp.]|jgi:hypothetical protein|nr:hypothetical protein [Treponema sp.]
MGQGQITGLSDGLKEAAAGLADRRKAGSGCKYGIQDFLPGAFAVFYFQHPSMPNFQEAMEKERKRNNPRTLFGVEKIPGDTVRTLPEGREEEPGTGSRIVNGMRRNGG